MVPSDFGTDHAAYSFTLWLRLGSGGSVAGVQVVHLVFTILG